MLSLFKSTHTFKQKFSSGLELLGTIIRGTQIRVKIHPKPNINPPHLREKSTKETHGLTLPLLALQQAV
jgi:hypothetical protein